MHVIHLNLEKGWRGGERQVDLLVRELASLGVEQTVIGRKGEPLLKRLSGVKGIRLVGAGGRTTTLLLLLRDPRPAVIHAHTGNTVAVAVLGRRGRALVATRRLDLPASGYWLGRMDKVVAISASVQDSLVRSGVKADRIVRIPSGVDLHRSLDAGLRPRMRAMLGVSEATPLGLTVAALEPQKDPLTLARALALLPEDYHHVWVGSGSRRRSMEEILHDIGVSDRCHLVGFDPDPDRWFAAADLFVLPSTHEGLGTVLLDAFHFGLPVVGTSVPGTADILRDKESALLVGPGDAAALAGAIGRLLADPVLGRTLVEHGRSVLPDYDIENTARAYMKLYRGLQ